MFSHKVLLKVIWLTGFNCNSILPNYFPEIRRPLRPPLEHHQREDLRLPLVLVRHHQRGHWHPDGLQVRVKIHTWFSIT
jgi:hypothetical protein